MHNNKGSINVLYVFFFFLGYPCSELDTWSYSTMKFSFAIYIKKKLYMRQGK